MARNKSAVFTLSDVTDDFIKVLGVDFEARELTLRESETLRNALEDDEVRNSAIRQGEMVYDFLVSRYKTEQDKEIFDKEFFLDHIKLPDLGKLVSYFMTGEVTRKNQKTKKEKVIHLIIQMCLFFLVIIMRGLHLKKLAI